MNAILITLGGLSIIVFLWSTIMIYSFLKDRNEKIQRFIFINLFIFRYIKRYKTITKNETGKIGYLYYLWIFTINLALLCFVLLMVFGDIL
jgi:hypothetical protein